MNEYLIELFEEENTVILPGLGALTVVNRATNELMFMSYLRHNDGTLVKYIAQKEGIEAESAKEKIDQYVQEINTIIENGGTFVISKIGSFSKDSSGDIQFSAIQNENETEAVEVIPVSVNPEVEQKTEEIQELPKEEVLPIVEEIEEKVNETFNNDSESAQETVEKPKDSVDSSASEIKEPLIVVEELKPLAATEEEQWNDDLDLPPLNYQPERPKKAILEKTKKDKKPQRNNTLWLMLLALVIFGGASYVGFNYNDLKEKIPFLASKKEDVKELSTLEIEELSEPVEEIEIYEEPVEEVYEEEIVKEEPKPIIKSEVKKVEERTKPAPVITSSGLRVDKSLPVQVIVGSFGEEANANRLVEKLRTQGFPAEVIGVYGGLHTVSTASFNSMDDYKANRSQLEGAGAHWVKK